MDGVPFICIVDGNGNLKQLLPDGTIDNNLIIAMSWSHRMKLLSNDLGNLAGSHCQNHPKSEQVLTPE